MEQLRAQVEGLSETALAALGLCKMGDQQPGGGGSSQRLVLGTAASSKKVVVPAGAGFAGFVKAVQHDLVLSARANGTRKAYVAWVEVFAAFLDKYGLLVVVSRQQQGCDSIHYKNEGKALGSRMRLVPM